jgi:hypothetical protein
MDNELNEKEIAFNKVTQWLREYGFRIDKEARNKTSNSQIQYEAKVYPPNQDRLFFKITFSPRWIDSFVIGSIIALPEEVSKSIEKGMKRREREQIYIDIDRLIFSLNLNCDFKSPRIYLHRLVFIDALKDKQFFFDSVFNLIHAMMLVEGKIDELINRFFPKE